MENPKESQPASAEEKDRETPDSSPDGVWALFNREWPHVKKAPYSFAICVLILSAVAAWFAYFLSEKFHEGTISAQAATIAHLSLRPESLPAQEEEIKALRVELEKMKAQSAHYLTDK